MAAGTRTAATANSLMFEREAKKIQNSKTGAPLRPYGLYFFDTGAVPILTTDIDDVNDEVYLAKFPDQCLLGNFQVTATDMDTNATPTLTFDVNTDSGAAEVTYINDCAKGQAGGTDDIDADVAHFGVDVSRLYLGIKVTAAAATGAAGTIRIRGYVWLKTPVIALS